MGQVYDLSPSLAALLVSEGWAEPAPWLEQPARKDDKVFKK